MSLRRKARKNQTEVRRKRRGKGRITHRFMYHNINYASMLEVAWADFFERAGVAFEYEPSNLWDGDSPWRPDFWLPGLKTYVEIKGRHVPDGFEERMVRLCVQHEQPILIFRGSPQRLVSNATGDSIISLQPGYTKGTVRMIVEGLQLVEAPPHPLVVWHERQNRILLPDVLPEIGQKILYRSIRNLANQQIADQVIDLHNHPPIY